MCYFLNTHFKYLVCTDVCFLVRLPLALLPWCGRPTEPELDVTVRTCKLTTGVRGQETGVDMKKAPASRVPRLRLFCSSFHASLVLIITPLRSFDAYPSRITSYPGPDTTSTICPDLSLDIKPIPHPCVD